MTVEQWAPWVTAAIGLVNLVAGIQAYRGRYRAWLMLKGAFLPGWPGLASLYLGGIIAVFWLPSGMLPEWIKETRRKMRAGEDQYSRDMAPGGALHGRLGVDARHHPVGYDGPRVAEPDDGGGYR